jgi:hypothetical protein
MNETMTETMTETIPATETRPQDAVFAESAEIIWTGPHPAIAESAEIIWSPAVGATTPAGTRPSAASLAKRRAGRRRRRGQAQIFSCRWRR